jgi:DNA repair ATPase RecN
LINFIFIKNSPNLSHEKLIIMKKHLNNIWILLIGAFLIYSCQESQNDSPQQLEMEVEEVVEIIANQFLFVEISGGNENQPFSSNQIEDSQNSLRISLDDNSKRSPEKMISCILNLNLDQSQMQEIRRLFFGLGNCQTEVMKKYRKEIREILSSMEEVRLNLLTKLRNGEISPDEFRKSMEELRKGHQETISDLRKNYTEEIKPCIRGFVAKLPIIMGRDNWLKFRACIKGD